MNTVDFFGSWNSSKMRLIFLIFFFLVKLLLVPSYLNNIVKEKDKNEGIIKSTSKVISTKVIEVNPHVEEEVINKALQPSINNEISSQSPSPLLEK